MRDLVFAIDVGTSSAKAGLLDAEGLVLARSSESYAYTTPRPHHVELDFELVWRKLMVVTRRLLADRKSPLRAVGLSVLCPGLVCLAEDGGPLAPALIHLDRRSVREARWALERIGKERFLAVAANLPYPGGVSLTSMLWLREHEPEVYARTRYFGHTNTFLAQRLTGRWGMDPSNASFTGLFKTVEYSDWDRELTRELGLDPERLPPIVASAAVVGQVTEQASRDTGIPAGTPVVMGGGDTACAALGADVVEEGEILNSTGTVEVMQLSTTHPIPSPRYLIRTHVVPDRWLIMNIISAGGEAIEWVRREFYREMSREAFFERHLPEVLLRSTTKVRMAPYLSGDRTSFQQRSASFSGLTLSSTRDDFLLATCQGLVRVMKSRYRHYEKQWKPTGRIRCTGGGVRALLELKKRNFPKVSWEEISDATLKGAARLAWMGMGRA
jgi:xylulokinase